MSELMVETIWDIINSGNAEGDRRKKERRKEETRKKETREEKRREDTSRVVWSRGRVQILGLNKRESKGKLYQYDHNIKVRVDK